MPGRAYKIVFDIAADQYGFLTAAQAERAGIERYALAMIAQRGEVEHVSYGLYRVAALPYTSLGQYMQATLWPAYGSAAVLSHETALDLHDVSDVNPAKIHFTLPKRHRIRRAAPDLYVIHYADLSPQEIGSHEGIPITTLPRTIRDCYVTHTGHNLLRQAIDAGLRLGRLRPTEANALKHEIFHIQPRANRHSAHRNRDQ